MQECTKCGCEVSCMGQVCPGCMTRMECEWCGGKGTMDSGGVTPWGEAIDLPCPHCTAKWDDLVAIGASWRRDSSLERWFPMTAEEIDRLRVQLAGCSVAALGGTQEDAQPNSYGWSPAYDDVLDLRKKYELAMRKSSEAVELLKSLHDWFLEVSPENYRGCGLWIDVDDFLEFQRIGNDAK